MYALYKGKGNKIVCVLRRALWTADHLGTILVQSLDQLTEIIRESLVGARLGSRLAVCHRDKGPRDAARFTK